MTLWLWGIHDVYYDRLPRMTLTLLLLMDDRKCLEVVRKMRWPDGVRCHKCGSSHVAKRGFDETQRDRQPISAATVNENSMILLEPFLVSSHR